MIHQNGFLAQDTVAQCPVGCCKAYHSCAPAKKECNK
jgi:hypothetical protein